MAYSRVKRRRQRRQSTIKQSLSVLSIGIVSLLAVKLFDYGFGAETIATEPSIKQVEQVKKVTTPEKETVNIAKPAVATPVEMTPEDADALQQAAAVEYAQVATPATAEVVQQTAQVYAAPTYTSNSTVLANGNSAGAIGTEAAARMAAATGVPQETWEYIIARESNGDPTVANPSGAAGLFQTIPGWGSTATVEDQINTAIYVYNNQGLAAWGMQ